ncbi:hypothetical protein [Enterococcus sp. AZ191]|uniref:hypothetical protein n=1 Tax=Enterococcus sp. AZ191 TaxID=2774639 RepID=UPI003F6854E0
MGRLEQVIQSFDDRKKLLLIWLLGLLFALCLLYMAYKIRNHSKIGLIALTTIGIFLGIVMTFSLIITVMLGINW